MAFAGTSFADAEVAVPRVRAAGGVSILNCSNTGGIVMRGVVSDVRKVDVHGYAAIFKVTQALTGSAKLGETVPIAWEELSSKRAVRFEDGDQILACFTELPSYTIWQRRFPDRELRNRTVLVGARGEAFLRSPTPAVLHGLEHYLAVDRRLRRRGEASTYLVTVAVDPGAQGLGAEARKMLAKTEELAQKLPESAVLTLARAASDEAVPVEIRRAAIDLITNNRLMAARKAIEELAGTPGDVRRSALLASASLAGGFSESKISELLESSDPAARQAALDIVAEDRDTATALGREALTSFVQDESPAVRKSAGGLLVNIFPDDALNDLTKLFGDADKQVRVVAAEQAATLGDKAIEPLFEFASQSDGDAALTAVAALSLIGESAGQKLQELHHEHEEESVRALAGLALGKGPDPDPH